MPTIRSDDPDAGRAADSTAVAPAESRGTPRSGPRLVKHALDRVLAACGLVVTAPVMAAVALAIRRRGARPVLRRADRLGEAGRRIRVLSFAISDEMRASSKAWDTIAGTGVTALPQLWNVVRGDLSLVGPRPRPPDTAPPPARPGLTGLAQLEQLSRWLPVYDQIALDDEYARTWSLTGDVRIVARTLWRVLR